MKQLILIIALILVSAIVSAYAIVSFVIWDGNPGRWNQDGRGGAILLATILFVIPSGLCIGYFNDKNTK